MSEEYVCPECGSKNIKTSIKNHSFSYIIEILTCKIPVRKCKDCGFTYQDHEAEDIIEATLKAETQRRLDNA